MADVNVLSYPTVDPALGTDKLYLVRGTGSDRDKNIEVKTVAKYSAGYDYVVSTQSEFEVLFGASWQDTSATFWDATLSAMKIPENTSILLKPIAGDLGSSWAVGEGDDGTNVYNGNPAYILRNKVYLSSNITIHGTNQDACIIIKNDGDNTNEADIKFYSTYKAQTTISAVSTNDFTVADSSSFVVGDIVHHSQDKEFYKIVSIPDSTSVFVDRNITGTGTGNLSSLEVNAILNEFTFDGRGGVDGLGGSISGTHGGAFNIPYIGNSIINCKLINHKVTGFGGALIGGVYSGIEHTSYNIKSENIYSCSAVNGAAASFFKYSELKAYYCSGDAAFTYIDYSNLYALSCEGGATACNYSKIIAYYCVSSVTDGGAAYACDYCDITAYYCSSQRGGGAEQCDYCSITAFGCTASVSGDIARLCDNSISIWGDTGTIVSCTLGGVRLVADDATGSGYTQPVITGGYTTAVS